MIARLFLIAWIGLFGAVSLGAAPAPMPVSPLSRLLHLVSDTPIHRHLLTYGDVGAWHESWGIPRVNDMAGVDALDATSKGRWLGAMPTQTNLPTLLNRSIAQNYRKAFGFDLFDVDRALQAGQPPDQITLWQLRVDPGSVAGALTASGYTSGTLGSAGVLYSIGADYQIMPGPGLPPSAALGDFNRVALLGDAPDNAMITAKATQPISEALAAQSGAVRSLADAPDYRAAVAALDDPGLGDLGPLLGVIFVDGPSLSLPDPALALSGMQQRLKDYEAGPQLPPYVTVAFATRHSSGASHLVLDVVFPPGADSAVAAGVLGKRLESYASVVTDASLSGRWSLEKAVGTTAANLPVALVVMRVPDPPPAAADASKPASVFSWSQLVYRRDTLFLTVGPGSN